MVAAYACIKEAAAYDFDGVENAYISLLMPCGLAFDCEASGTGMSLGGNEYAALLWKLKETKVEGASLWHWCDDIQDPDLLFWQTNPVITSEDHTETGKLSLNLLGIPLRPLCPMSCPRQFRHLAPCFIQVSVF